MYRVILSKFSTPIPNFIVDPTPLFLRENKPRRFLEPCYCIMGRLVSQERNRNLFSLFQNDPQGFPSASSLFYHTFLLSSIKKDEPLLRMTHYQYNINYSVSSSRTYRMISPTSQSSILQNMSIVWVLTPSLCRRRVSWAGLMPYWLMRAYCEIPRSFITFQSPS